MLLWLRGLFYRIWSERGFGRIKWIHLIVRIEPIRQEDQSTKSYLNSIAFTGFIFRTSNVGMMSEIKQTTAVTTQIKMTCHQMI